MYVGASLTAGYGMQYRENFLHHSLEVPGLHGRGGICALLPPLLARAFVLRKLWMLMGRVWGLADFDDHLGGVTNTSGNVMYKAAGRSFLVNGGAGNNITSNLIMETGLGIYNQAADNSEFRSSASFRNMWNVLHIPPRVLHIPTHVLHIVADGKVFVMLALIQAFLRIPPHSRC